jgi:ribosome-associated translation inhibitor RaiA
MIASDQIHVSRHGDVPQEGVVYARDKLVALIERIREPVLYAEVELDHAPDPARERPAQAEATIDLNGKLIRAHVASSEFNEAIDLLADVSSGKAGSCIAPANTTSTSGITAICRPTDPNTSHVRTTSARSCGGRRSRSSRWGSTRRPSTSIGSDTTSSCSGS